MLLFQFTFRSYMIYIVFLHFSNVFLDRQFDLFYFYSSYNSYDDMYIGILCLYFLLYKIINSPGERQHCHNSLSQYPKLSEPKEQHTHMCLISCHYGKNDDYGKFITVYLMNIVSSGNAKNVVSLQQLVPQHDCLKLLILHTPYTLVINTLGLCINLVKLDLSKNNLESFPYLGNLVNLRFMFIHENRLDVNGLKKIFELEGVRSQLSLNIVWVTFWGNKNGFIGRHYLANQTNAIAIDRNMVVHQEKYPDFRYNQFNPFCQQSDLSNYFTKKSTTSRFNSEEEYMRQLWLEMAELRRKHQKLFPIVKIQKVFRGWMVREMNKRKANKKIQTVSIINSCFKQWKIYSKRQRKLKAILKGKRKEYLVYDLKEMRTQEIISKMLQFAREVKLKIFNRRNSLKNEIRFYGIVRQNWLHMKNIYNQLQVKKSKAIYIQKQHVQLFQRTIIPYLRLVNKQKIEINENNKYIIQLVYEFYGQKTREFIKILNTNIKSIVYNGTSQGKSKNARRPKLYGSSIKPIYEKVHISTLDRFKMNNLYEKLQYNKKMSLGEIYKIEGNIQTLKDIIRGIYFFNTKRFSQDSDLNHRIHVFTDYQLHKSASITKIQKVWRGYSYRKKNSKAMLALLKVQRAVVTIQRWVRKLPNFRKKMFLYKIIKALQQVKEDSFLIQMNEYVSFVNNEYLNSDGFKFQQLYSRTYLNKQTKSLCLLWDEDSQNTQVMQNIKLRRCLFTKKLMKEKVGFKEDQVYQRSVFNSNVHQLCNMSYVFHYQTDSTIICKGSKKYLQVKCGSIQEAKFRILALLTLSHRIEPKKNINVYFSRTFKIKDNIKRLQIDELNGIFICNQNFEMIKLCETKFQNSQNTNLHIINNRFYLQSEIEKPVKVDEKFFIYSNLIKESKIKKKQSVEDTNETRQLRIQFHNKVNSTDENFRMMTQHRFVDTSEDFANTRPIQNKNLKIMIKKRSVKNFKIEKRNKNKTVHPHFILDSSTINDRLTTMPDIIQTQGSNQQNNSLQHNFEDKSDIVVKQRATYLDRSKQAQRKKDDDNFTKRFINLGNFIQNQYANDYRRRIKTELQNRAADSAEVVRRQIERSQSHKIQQTQQKHKKIRQRHSQHKQLVQKTQSLMKQHSNQVKNEIIQNRQKKFKERAKLKKLKVSFAEECYPLASRNRKNDYFA